MSTKKVRNSISSPGMAEVNRTRSMSTVGTSDSRARSSTVNSMDTVNINSIESLKISSASKSEQPPNEREGNVTSPTFLISDILNSLGSSKDKDEYYIVSKGNDLVSLFSKYPSLRDDIVIKSLMNKIQFMFFHRVSEVRSVGYRLLRYIIGNYENLLVIIHSKILIFIIISMSSHRSSLLEKVEALKLIRHFCEIPKGTDTLSIGVVKSLISLIETEEGEIPENFRTMCIESLCEIAILKPELLFLSGGCQIIIDTIMDGPKEISSICLLVLIKLLDNSDSRKFLRNGLDLNCLSGAFSNVEETTQLSPSKFKRIAFLITIFFKTFTGLMSMSLNDFRCIDDFLLNLKKKNKELRSYILDVLLDVLRIEVLPWLQTSEIGQIIESIKVKLEPNCKTTFKYEQIDNQSFEYNLVNHYLGLLVLIFVNKNISSILMEVIEDESDKENTRKAKTLLTHIYNMSHRLLPVELLSEDSLLPVSMKNQVLMGSINELDDYDTKTSKITMKHAQLKSYIMNMNIDTRSKADDADFKLLINKSRVLTIKEFDNWRWNILLHIIQGPLRNPKRFDELNEKSPKFLKRLFSFFRPFKYRYSNLSIRHSSFKKITYMGCQLIEALLTFPNGIRYLSSSKLLPQIAEIFAQVDALSGISAEEPILSESRLRTGSSKGYLKMIGVLSHDEHGRKLLERWQFYTLISDIVEYSSTDTSNNYLLMNLFKQIDFVSDSKFRIILAQACTISSITVKGFIIDNILSDLLSHEECEKFVVKVLVHQLYDESHLISNRVVGVLSSFFEKSLYENLSFFISLRPPINLLSKSASGKELLINLLRSSDGFKYLEEVGFIESEMSKWLTLSNSKLLKHLENTLRKLFFPYSPLFNLDSFEIYSKFIKNLFSTPEGLQFVLSQHRDFAEKLISDVESSHTTLKAMTNSLTSQDANKSKRLIDSIKLNLWITGLISSSKYGIQLLDPLYNTTLSKSVAALVLDIFHTCPIWQIRGLAFYVMGMIASTVEGVEILDELNWISVMDEYSNPRAFCYPNASINSLFDVKPTNPYRDIKYYSIFSGINTSDNLFNEIDDLIIENDEQLDVKVLNLIQYLNSVLGRIERKAKKELQKVKKNNPATFKNLNLFLEVIKLIDRGSFKYHTRKFIFDLFLDETRILEQLMKRDRISSQR